MPPPPSTDPAGSAVTTVSSLRPAGRAPRALVRGELPGTVVSA